MIPSSEQRRLAAIMFTDMAGYSDLAQRDETLALGLLQEHREIIRGILPRFHGIEIKTIGDAFLVEFDSALEAAQCAIEIQRILAKRNHDVPGAAYFQKENEFRRKRLAEGKYQSPLGIALNYAMAGDDSEALDWLEKAVEERTPWLPELKVDPNYDGVRSQARFVAVLKRIGLER